MDFRLRYVANLSTKRLRQIKGETRNAVSHDPKFSSEKGKLCRSLTFHPPSRTSGLVLQATLVVPLSRGEIPIWPRSFAHAFCACRLRRLGHAGRSFFRSPCHCGRRPILRLTSAVTHNTFGMDTSGARLISLDRDLWR